MSGNRNSYSFRTSSFTKSFRPGMDRPDIQESEFRGEKDFDQEEPTLMGLVRNNNQVSVFLPEDLAMRVSDIHTLPIIEEDYEIASPPGVQEEEEDDDESLWDKFQALF